MRAKARQAAPAVAILSAALGIGAIVLQRWVAATRFDAIVYVAIWFAVVGVAAVAYVLGRRELRLPLLGSYAAILVVSGAVGYWWGFRDHEVHEKVVMASTSVNGAEQTAALAGGSAELTEAQQAAGPSRGNSAGGSSARGQHRTERSKRQATKGPVSLARGSFTGQDGHSGSGRAEVVRTPGGQRLLTFTDFDVSPGAKVVVWLTRDEGSTDDRIELGNLKGNVGDQQYEIPESADLTEYDTVVLYCTPFTVRIATAELG